MFVVLQRNGHGPQATVLPDKQLLVALWYQANKTSVREVVYLFGLSIPTVHDNKGVYKAIGQPKQKGKLFHIKTVC